MDVNGESLYGTGPSPFGNLDWGRATQKGSTLYLHVFDWPEDSLEIPALKNQVEKVYLLTEPDTQLNSVANADSIRIEVPSRAPDPIASVVVLELDNSPIVLSGN
jgi:alpha-L-fucosidase